jgi:hypothetical protein
MAERAIIIKRKIKIEERNNGYVNILKINSKIKS